MLASWIIHKFGIKTIHKNINILKKVVICAEFVFKENICPRNFQNDISGMKIAKNTSYF